MEVLGKITITVLVMALLSVVTAFTFEYMWNTLVVPGFNTFSITASQAYIVLLIKGFVFAKLDDNDDEKSFIEQLFVSVVKVIIVCLFFSLVTWIASSILF